ncbi:ribosomal protein L7/L12 [Streptomyces sp. NPDC059525]|uniref:ribosomal protein L7/L12 n=1 Tax=Streptomyces sp. NPDC059525 TaxID=3346857 RepID=UPI0036A9DCE4
MPVRRDELGPFPCTRTLPRWHGDGRLRPFLWGEAEAIRAIRTITGLSLWNSRLLLDRAPVAVTEPGWLEAAEDAAGVLETAGAHATVLCDWCDRTITRGAGPLDPAPCSGPWPPETCRASRPPAL